MIDIYFKECCKSCPNLDLDWEQTKGLGEMVTVIICSHACVCGQYNTTDTQEDNSQNIEVKGFYDADG